MSNKITRAFASIANAFSHGPSKPPAPSGKAGALRPGGNAALQDLSARKGAMAAAASLAKGADRPRISAHDLSHAIAAGQARSQARAAARIKALPTPALPLDVQMRFDALKARAPKSGSGGGVLKREPDHGLPQDLQSRFDALKASTPKPGGASGKLKSEPAADSPEGLQMRFDALKASMPKPASGGGSLKHEPERTNDEKAGADPSKPASTDVEVSVSVHADGESAKPVESSVSNEKLSDHGAEGPKAEGPKAEGPKAEGPKAEGPKAEGPEAGGPEPGDPEAGGPEAGGPKAEGAKAEEVKTEPQDHHEELAGLAGKVNDHVNGMHQAAAAHPSEQEQLMMQEMAELNQLAMLFSQLLARFTQLTGGALLSITRQ